MGRFADRSTRGGRLFQAAAAAFGLAALAACATPVQAPPVSPPPSAQPAPPPIRDLAVRVEPGDAWQVVSEVDLASNTLGRVTRETVRETYRVDVTGPDQWRWTLLQSGGVDAAAAAADRADIAAALRFGPIDCRVTPGGLCLEVTNWEARRGQLLANQSQTPVPDTSPSGEATARAAAVVQSALMQVSAEDAAALLLQNVAVLGRVQGLRMAVGQSIAYDASLPAPIGGRTVPVRGLITLESVDDAAGTARVIYRQESAENAGAALREAMAAIMRASSGDADGADAEDAMSLTDALLGEVSYRFSEDGVAIVDLSTGLVREARSTLSGRAATSGGVLPFELTVSGDTSLAQDEVATTAP